jgi:hypothetical protein
MRKITLKLCRLALAHELAITHNEQSIEKSHEQYNRKAKDPELCEGDLILYKNILPIL